MFLSVPFHFDSAHPERAKTLESYFGDYKANSSLGQLKTACQKNMPLDFVKAGAKVLVLDAELDPEDEILKPRDAFVEEWLRSPDPAMRGALAVDQMPRHNHISPFASLSTGIEQEEAWGGQVVAFFDNIRKFAPL